MSIGIIELLEKVDVHHLYSQCFTLLVCFLEHLLCLLIHQSTIGNLCQRIDCSSSHETTILVLHTLLLYF